MNGQRDVVESELSEWLRWRIYGRVYRWRPDVSCCLSVGISPCCCCCCNLIIFVTPVHATGCRRRLQTVSKARPANVVSMPASKLISLSPTAALLLLTDNLLICILPWKHVSVRFQASIHVLFTLLSAFVCYSMRIFCKNANVSFVAIPTNNGWTQLKQHATHAGHM